MAIQNCKAEWEQPAVERLIVTKMRGEEEEGGEDDRGENTRR